MYYQILNNTVNISRTKFNIVLAVILTLFVCSTASAQSTQTSQERSRNKSNLSWLSQINGENHCNALYKLKFITQDVSGAGTDSDISITLTGYNGNSLILPSINDAFGGDIFEREDIDEVNLCVNGIALGRVGHISIVSDGAFAGSGWDLSSVTVTHPDDKNSIFTKFPNTIDDDAPASASCRPCVSDEDWTVYIVEVKTSNISGAGTDGDIRLKLAHGSNLSGPEFTLNDTSSGDVFESGDTDSFTVWSSKRALPNVSLVGVKNFGGGVGSDWYLETIKLTDIDGNDAVFEFQEWINPDTANTITYGTLQFEIVKKPQEDFSERVTQYEFFTNLGADSPRPQTKSFTLTASRFAQLEKQSSTSSDTTITGSGGFSAGDAGGFGWEASVEQAFGVESSETATSGNNFEIQKNVTEEITILPQTFHMEKCVWNNYYSAFSIKDSSQIFGVITNTPVCQGEAAHWPNERNLPLDAVTAKAVVDKLGLDSAKKIFDELETLGVVVEGRPVTINVAIDCEVSGISHETTNNTITVAFYSAQPVGFVPFLFVDSDSKNGISSCSSNAQFQVITAQPIDLVTVSTNGEDGYMIDTINIQGPNINQTFGVDNDKGWCLSTDPNDGKGDWINSVTEEGCQSSHSFNF